MTKPDIHVRRACSYWERKGPEIHKILKGWELWFLGDVVQLWDELLLSNPRYSRRGSIETFRSIEATMRKIRPFWSSK